MKGLHVLPSLLQQEAHAPGQGQPKGHLPHCTSGQRFLAPSSLPKPKGRSLSVHHSDSTLLSIRLHKTYKANSSASTLSRNLDTHLLG